MQIGKPIYHNLAWYVRKLNTSLVILDVISLNIWNSKTHIWDSLNETVTININDDEDR